MLQYPYPNPYIELSKKKIYIYKIKKVKVKTKTYKKSLLYPSIKKGYYIKLKDNYAKITSGKITLIK